MSEKTHKVAVGVFHDAKSLQSAADALLTQGFDHADLSLLAGRSAVEEKLGHAYSSVSELEDEANVAITTLVDEDSRTEAKSAAVGGLIFVGATAAIGAVVASGGTVAAAAIAALAAGGGGGAIGAVLARLIERHHADALQEQLDKGGLLLWVHTANSDQETRALEILKAEGGEHVHLHELPEVSYEGDSKVYGYLDWLAGEPRPER